MLKILQISTSDQAGGAERIALSLHRAYRGSRVESVLAVGSRSTREAGVVHIDNERLRGSWSRTLRQWANSLWAANRRGLKGAGRLAWLLVRVAEPVRRWRISRGLEDFDYPASRRLCEQVVRDRIDAVHCHNLHGGYFDLRILARLSKLVPVFLTLHDAWLLSGHCAYGGACERWRTGCGECPDLTSYPAVERDATRQNWRAKAAIFADSRFHVATPSRWLMDEVEASMLMPAILSRRVITNGIDLSVFRPADRRRTRAELGLPQDQTLLLFAAQGVRSNKYKDYACIEGAVRRVSERLGTDRVLFVAVGDDGREAGQPSNDNVQFVPYQTSPERMAQYYQAADIYLHAARADTFPNTVLEALACGTPVVATAVGGIPEQVQDGVTGFLTPASDPVAMASRILELLCDPARLQTLGAQAAVVAAREFAMERMAQDYLEWYCQVLDSNAAQAKPPA